MQYFIFSSRFTISCMAGLISFTFVVNFVAFFSFPGTANDNPIYNPAQRAMIDWGCSPIQRKKQWMSTSPDLFVCCWRGWNVDISSDLEVQQAGEERLYTHRPPQGISSVDLFCNPLIILRAFVSEWNVMWLMCVSEQQNCKLRMDTFMSINLPRQYCVAGLKMSKTVKTCWIWIWK